MSEKIVNLLRSTVGGKDVTINGWIRTRRDSKGGFSFLEVNDGSCLANLQVVAPATLTNYESTIRRLYPGAAVEVQGKLVESQGGKQKMELSADSVLEIGSCPVEEYPIGKQRVSFELLREMTHLRPRTNTLGAVMRVRNKLSFLVHRYFQENGFLYIHTPILTSNDCEGAGNIFNVVARDPTSATAFKWEEEFFKKPTHLTVSGQLELEAYALSLGDVYSFGPTFRAENSHTSRHLAEFWMIEPEMAFADLDRNAQVAEELLRYVAKGLLAESVEDLEFFNQRIDTSLLAGLNALAESKFTRLTYTEAVDLLIKSGKKFEFPLSWGMDLQSEHERYLTEEIFKGPVVLTDYPKEIKAFYMRVNDDGKTVRAMDVLLPKVGEIIGGAQREERLDILLERMKECSIDSSGLQWFLDLRKFGTAPHAGFGLGFERLVQTMTGMSNIRDVIPFPRAAGQI